MGKNNKRRTAMKKYIIFDTREKKIGHITTFLKQQGKEYRTEKLDSGDITFFYNGKDYRDDFVIERKQNMNEIFNNIVGKDRKRINREFKRLLKVPTVYFLIEETNYEIAIMHLKKRNYKMNTLSFPAKFKTWIKFRQYERNQANQKPIEIVYCHNSDTHKVIIKLINEYLTNINSKS